MSSWFSINFGSFRFRVTRKSWRNIFTVLHRDVGSLGSNLQLHSSAYVSRDVVTTTSRIQVVDVDTRILHQYRSFTVKLHFYRPLHNYYTQSMIHEYLTEHQNTLLKYVKHRTNEEFFKCSLQNVYKIFVKYLFSTICLIMSVSCLLYSLPYYKELPIEKC